MVTETLLTLQPTIGHGAVLIEQRISADLGLDSYPGPLGQVLMNLVNNALLHGFAGNASGSLRIAARAVEPGLIELSLQDDGRGISPDHLERIFDPFFSTRFGQGGSGLGLSIMHSIVTGLLGGRIAVHSQPGEGTRFCLTLPEIAPLRSDQSAGQGLGD